MDDVEVLAVEQGADPPDQVEGEGDSRHPTRCPHRHAAADADEAGDAVVVGHPGRGRQDGDVVAAAAQLIGQVTYVLGHPTGVMKS